MSYKLIFTNIGLTKIANAELNNGYVEITKFAVGDGVIALNPALTGLAGEKYRADIGGANTENGITTLDLVIPSDIGGFYIREIALYDIAGDCIAIGTVPVTYKVAAIEGAAKAVHIRVQLQSANADNLSFIFDDSITYIPRADVIDLLTSTAADKPLSANMGKLLKELVDTKLNATANAVSASKLAIARTITLAGDASGSAAFDGTGNITITLAIVDDSHNHIIGNVDGLQTALDAKLSLQGGTLDGGTNTVLTILSNDDGKSHLILRGDSQGTGVVEVAQSTTYGGGMFYNGDGTPSFAEGEVADTLSFFLRINNVVKPIFYASVNDEIVRFVKSPTAPTPPATDNSTDLATTAFVKSIVGSDIPAVSKTTNGYYKMPNGLIIQWHRSPSVVNHQSTVYFPVSFPSACLTVVASERTASATAGSINAVGIADGSISASSFIVGFSSGQPDYLNYIAIGY